MRWGKRLSSTGSTTQKALPLATEKISSKRESQRVVSRSVELRAALWARTDIQPIAARRHPTEAFFSLLNVTSGIHAGFTFTAPGGCDPQLIFQLRF
jgi:hypothetical protein